MSATNMRAMRHLVVKALAGDADPNDPHSALSMALEQLSLTADALAHASENGALKTGHVLALRGRIEAVERFVDDCLQVNFKPLEGSGGAS